MKLTTKTLATGGIFAAMVTIGTLVIRIPIPTGGYIHIGDSLVYLSGILLGPVLGAVVSGLGSAIADLFGYAEYVPATLVIKALDALVTASVFMFVQKNVKGFNGTLLGYILGVLCGGSVMVGGYFTYEVALKGFAYAASSLSFNAIQAFGGAIVALPVLVALAKTKYFSQLSPFMK